MPRRSSSNNPVAQRQRLLLSQKREFENLLSSASYLEFHVNWDFSFSDELPVNDNTFATIKATTIGNLNKPLIMVEFWRYGDQRARQLLDTWNVILAGDKYLSSAIYAYRKENPDRVQDRLFIPNADVNDLFLALLFARHANPAFARGRYRKPNINMYDPETGQSGFLANELQKHLAKKLVTNDFVFAVLSTPNNIQDLIQHNIQKAGISENNADVTFQLLLNRPEVGMRCINNILRNYPDNVGNIWGGILQRHLNVDLPQDYRNITRTIVDLAENNGLPPLIRFVEGRASEEDIQEIRDRLIQSGLISTPQIQRPDNANNFEQGRVSETNIQSSTPTTIIPAGNIVDSVSNWLNRTLFANRRYNQILERRPVAGAEYEGGQELVLTKEDEETKRAINNLIEIASNRPQGQPVFEYNYTILPLNLAYQDNEIGSKLRKALRVTGAISKSGPFMNIWLPNNEEIARYIEAAGLRGYNPQIDNLDELDLRNFDNWDLVNIPGKKVSHFSSGFFIPVQQGKAIYLPTFVTPDATIGVEFEAPIDVSYYDVQNKFQQLFGVTPEAFGRVRSDEFIKIVPDASLDYGMEYISTTMPLFDGIRFNYMLAEVLKTFNPEIGMNRRGDPYGLHINMSIAPLATINRERLIQYTSQYLRILENVIKRISTSDLRYNYLIEHPWSFHRRTAGNIRDIGMERFRQFWSKDISDVIGYEGVREYDLLRTGRTLTERFSGETPEKISKYHTISFEKLKDHSVIEFRHALYKPDGSYVANTIGMLSKFLGDIYYGVYYTPEIINSSPYAKIIPQKRYSQEQFAELMGLFFGIQDSESLQFMWNTYNQCKNLV